MKNVENFSALSELELVRGEETAAVAALHGRVLQALKARNLSVALALAADLIDHCAQEHRPLGAKSGRMVDFVAILG